MSNDNALLNLALSAYLEPCRICGQTLTRDDMQDAVFAGYGRNAAGNVTRVAHGACWNARRDDRASWAYPIDGVEAK